MAANPYSSSLENMIKVDIQAIFYKSITHAPTKTAMYSMASSVLFVMPKFGQKVI